MNIIIILKKYILDKINFINFIDNLINNCFPMKRLLSVKKDYVYDDTTNKENIGKEKRNSVDSEKNNSIDSEKNNSINNKKYHDVIYNDNNNAKKNIVYIKKNKSINNLEKMEYYNLNNITCEMEIIDGEIGYVGDFNQYIYFKLS